MERIRVAFVGCGNIARTYIQVYCSLPFVELSLCVDVNLEMAQSAAGCCATTGGEMPRVSTRFEDALAASIDMVVVNTPNDLHAPQAIAAMQAGKHVLLQKPLAANLADSRRIRDAALASRKIVGMYMSYLDQPLLHDFRELNRLGFYGDVVELYGRAMHTYGAVWSKQALDGAVSWRNSVKRTGGGCFIQLAVHYIHLAHWILRSPITHVQVDTANRYSPGLEGEDVGFAQLQTATGARIVLSTAWCATGEQLAITGTLRGTTYAQQNYLITSGADGFAFKGHALSIPESAKPSMLYQIGAPAIGDSTNPFNQHRRFLEAVRDGRPPDVTVEEAFDDMQVLAACYDSAREGKRLAVDYAK